ncbi:EAL domain-containing protein [Sulfuritalea sp.]|uniref:putative bifunctional diguanylate cyclase/phosphodiesterase n=1 Tax=Sulfuritalea sp. TaxID=2480090 RepID=UPI00286E4A6C|nr:EAL domain-containing protein [Sulfuritalea sp.]
MSPSNSGDAINSQISWEPSLACLKFAIYAMLAGSFAALLALYIVAPGHPTRAIGPIVLVLVAMAGWSFLLRGRIRTAVIVLLIGSWMAVTGIAAFNGGVGAPVIVAYPMIVILVGLVISSRAAFAVAAVCVIAIVSFVLAESSGFLPSPPPIFPALRGVVHAIVLVLSATLAATFVRAYTDQLDELRVVSSELAQRTMEMDASRADLHRAQAVAKVGSWVYDLVTDTMHLSTEACRVFDVPEGTTGSYDTYLVRTHTEDRDAAAAAWRAALDGAALDYEHRILVGKTIRWVRLRAEVEFAPDGTPLRAVGVSQDITERKAAEEEIRRLAFYDSLTHLPNRRLLHDRLQQALVSSTRSGRKVALLFIDLDNFKTLNDTLGHDVGDKLLKKVAKRLTACVREGDTVARLGGDEFVVVLEDLNEDLYEAAAHTKSVAEKILATLGQPYDLAGHHCGSTPSIGIALFADDQTTIDDLMKRADVAMYQAKDAGRNTLRFFDPEMQAVVGARLALEADLRQGLAQGQLLLHFQAQVDGSGRVTGAEALVRWQHPQRGMVSPAEFIPLAEETGLILPLGDWVLTTACNQLVAWARQPATAHLTLAVNVSARQFRQPDFVTQARDILADSGADPRKLKLELTESTLLEDIEDIIAKMNDLKALGVSFSLDDFGTGYSSLSYLKRLPLDQLKIDQSFVRDILTDPNDVAIARTIVALAQSLGLSVIAEGVETEAQRELLANSGCHAYQGYLFAHPLPTEAFGELVRRA